MMKRHPCLFLTLLACILVCTPRSHAAEPTYEVISTDITPDNEYRVFLLDKLGFIWLGTDSGVEVYDSNGRPAFDPRLGTLRSLQGLAVSALYESGSDIWIGGDRGLYLYDKSRNKVEKFTAKTKYGVTISSKVSSVLGGSAGKLWIATEGQGLFIYDPSDGTLTQDSRHGSFYSDLALGADGLVYAVTIRGVLQSFLPDGRLAREYTLPGLQNNKSQLCLAASGKDIWMASGSTLFRVNVATGEVSRVATPGLRGPINTLLARQNGTLLLSTNSEIWEYRPVNGDFSEIRQHRHSTGTHDLIISTIAEMPDGNIAIVHATAPLEVMMVRPGPISFVALPEGTAPSGAFARSFVDTADGSKVWVGTDEGVFLYDFTKRSFVTPDIPQLRGTPVKSLARKGDTLWIGTRSDGLYTFNTTNGTLRHYVYDEKVPYSLLSNEINHVGVTADGDVLILTDWGVCRYDPRADNFPQLTEIGQNIRASSMAEEKDGTVWIKSENFGYFSKAPDSSRFEHVEPDAPHPAVFDSLRFNFDMRRFGVHNSVASSAFDLNNGLTAFGAQNGFIIIDPVKLKDSRNSTFAYPISISFPFLEKPGEELDRLGINASLMSQGRIELPFKDNTFTLRFSGIHPLTDPDVKYDYMLRGVDKDWIQGANVSEVTYSNVPSGEFEFLIRPHGIENAQVKSLQIRVLPPWYRSFWALVVYLVLAVLAAVGIFLLSRKLIRLNFRKKMKEMREAQQRETFEARSRYFVNLVHEIRTPLMLISMPLEQLSDENEREAGAESAGNTGERRKYIRAMQANVDYLLGITNQLLDFRKAETQSEVRLNVSRFDIKALLLGLTRRFDETLRLSGKTLTCDLPEGEIWVKGDVVKLERVLMNLLGNAMKYADSAITVTLRELGDEEIRITVGDDGRGIPEKERVKVFDTYYQIQSDKLSVSLGTGLGLAYAKLITEAHKGRITADENPAGHGALFSLTIPRDSGVASEELEQLTGGESAQETGPREKKDVTVLLVEDNEDLRSMISDTLGKYYEVLSAPDGVAALEVMKEKDVDIVVSDVMMDRMDGMELCRRVKDSLDYSHIPFIILTALTTPEAHDKGLGCGADVYLEKPFPMKQLVMQIENLLRTRRLFHEKMKEAMPAPAGAIGAEGAEAQEAHPGLNRLDAEFLDKMNALIEKAAAEEEFSIDMLARNLNLSRSSFYRKITALTGMSPNDYLKNFRLNRAAQLLRDGCRVSDVADRVGFTSSSYFAKCFRAKFGVLPSEFV